MPQLDGCESYLNAINETDTNGQIKEVVSPRDRTDLFSTIDQECGSFIKLHFNKSFQEDFRSRPDGWQLGKVSARERRVLFTKWTCDAVEKLMERRDIIRRAFRGTGVGIDGEGKMKNYIRFSDFQSYVSPKIDEEYEIADFTEEEIKAMEKQEGIQNKFPN